MAQTTISCRDDVKERLESDKPDDMSWSEYLDTLAPGEGITTQLSVGVTPELDQDALDELKDELSMVADPGTVLTDADVERMMDTLDTVEERTGRLERLLEEVTGR